MMKKQGNMMHIQIHCNISMQKHRKGIEQGRTEGLELGRTEGLEKGIEQGRTEERENSIARFIKYVKLGVISKKDACQDLGMTEKELDKYLQA